MRTYLAIERLTVAYGGTTVLERLDLAVARAELVALLGASGCGKTTLLRAVCGFAPVRSGRIAVDGRPTARMLARFRSAAARLLDPETAPPGTLLLRGTVEQTAIWAISGATPCASRTARSSSTTPSGWRRVPPSAWACGCWRSTPGRAMPARRRSTRSARPGEGRGRWPRRRPGNRPPADGGP